MLTLRDDFDDSAAATDLPFKASSKGRNFAKARVSRRPVDAPKFEAYDFLPAELKLHILSFLDYQSAMNARAVNRETESLVVEAFKGIASREKLTIKKMALGEAHSLALVEDAKTGLQHLYVWGDNRFGQLGMGLTHQQFPQAKVPIDITNKFPAGAHIVDICAGGRHNLAIVRHSDNTHHIYSWGSNLHGQLGNGSSETQRAPVDITDRFPPNCHFLSIHAGLFHSFCLLEDANNQQGIFCFGNNIYGALGLGDTEGSVETPTYLEDLLERGDSLLDIQLGAFHSCLLVQKANGTKRIFTAGRNLFGQLGCGDAMPREVFIDITGQFPDEFEIQWMRAADNGLMFYGADDQGVNHLYACGDNSHGQLGTGNKDNQMTPLEIPLGFLNGFLVRDIQAGKEHTLLSAFNPATGESALFGWGHSKEHRFGRVTREHELRPVDISAQFCLGKEILGIGVGREFSQVLVQNSDGALELQTCGSNKFGQLGGHYRRRSRPRGRIVGPLNHGMMLPGLSEKLKNWQLERYRNLYQNLLEHGKFTLIKQPSLLLPMGIQAKPLKKHLCFLRSRQFEPSTKKLSTRLAAVITDLDALSFGYPEVNQAYIKGREVASLNWLPECSEVPIATTNEAKAWLKGYAHELLPAPEEQKSQSGHRL